MGNGCGNKKKMKTRIKSTFDGELIIITNISAEENERMSKGKIAGYITLVIVVALILWFIYYLFGVPAAEVQRAEQTVQKDGAVLLNIADEMRELGIADINREGYHYYEPTEETFPKIEYNKIYYSIVTREKDAAEKARELLPELERLHGAYGITQYHLMSGYLEFAVDAPPGPVPRIIYFPGSLIYSKELSEKELKRGEGLNIVKDLGNCWYLAGYPE